MTTYCSDCGADMDDDNESYMGACPECGEFPDCGQDDPPEYLTGEYCDEMAVDEMLCPRCSRAMLLYKPAGRGFSIYLCSGLYDTVNPCSAIVPVRERPVMVCPVCGRKMIPVAETTDGGYSYWYCSGYNDTEDPCREAYRFERAFAEERIICKCCGRDMQPVFIPEAGEMMLRCSGYGMARQPCDHIQDIPAPYYLRHNRAAHEIITEEDIPF